MTRWHTAEGLVTGDGPSLTISGHFNRHHVHPVPGDLDSRVLVEVGAVYLARPSGGGRLVLQDTGRVTFAPGADFEVVASSGGVHDAYSDPTAIDRAICDALIRSAVPRVDHRLEAGCTGGSARVPRTGTMIDSRGTRVRCR